MNTSSLKKLVAAIVSQDAVGQSLIIVDELLVFMKKFWKQLSQNFIIDFMKKQYPDAYDLYVLLGWSRSSIKGCLLLKQYLIQAMWENFIVSHTSHESLWLSLKSLNNQMSLEISWDVTNPFLFVQSPTRTYRRSLNDDLIKIIQ